MYVTRPLSLYKTSPAALLDPPPEGPNSGYLVVQDEEYIGNNTSKIDLPFPQNKRLKIQHQIGERSVYHHLYFIPVINQRLSSKRYYAIKAEGKHKGEAYASSTEVDKPTSCFGCKYNKDQKPRPLNPDDIYQQFKFSRTKNTASFVRSVVPGGYPPALMRLAGGRLWISEPKHFSLDVAKGLDSTLRARLPDFDFPLSQDHCKVQVVGKWYTPFMFIKEGTPKEQMKISMFYEVTLEQKWERIYYRENNSDEGGIVSFDVVVPSQRVAVNMLKAEEIISKEVGQTVWYRTMAEICQGTKIGISSLLVERMVWEQERVGWSVQKEKQVKVARTEKYGGIGSWKRFGCYMLVERFVFRRMDRSSALMFYFNHTHQVKIKWDGRS